MPNITQIQTHAEIGYTFARALRAILRQDPDVIMIGEIRDLETAEIAIRSALTGHLVLSTVHTNDALSSFTRLIDMGVEPFLVVTPVRGVQAQRLVRKACTRCARPIDPPARLREQLKRLPPQLVGDRWVKVEGCDACRHTGYSGRTGIYELVPVSVELQELIVSGAKLTDLKALALEQGHRTLLQDGLIKASHGNTTLEEITRLALED
jgi:general secretion pathway protein E